MTSEQPNIVFILADDLGYADLSVYGNIDFKTPNLDRLASEGARFTQGYASSAVCSATRFALITGRYQYHLPGGLEEPLVRVGDNLGLPAEHPTLPSLLKEQGYETALIGKWHLGRPPKFGPLVSGYDKFFGNFGGAIDYFTHKLGAGPDVPTDLWEGDVPVERTGYYTTILSDEAVKYVKEEREKPYFLSLHYTAPHWPWEGPNDADIAPTIKDPIQYDGGNLKKYAEIVQSLDEGVGKVLKAIEESGKTENTIIIFTSDNGGERFSFNWPFLGQKTELLEGGIRVPTLFKWPAQVKPQVNEQVVVTLDWLPTLLAAAGGKPDPDYPTDGENVLPVLKGEAPHDRTLYFRYKACSQRALRDGNLKYLKINDNEFLFDVVIDQRERANLKDKQPEDFERLKKLWAELDKNFLPITSEVFSHGISPDVQADHYVPEELKRTIGVKAGRVQI